MTVYRPSDLPRIIDADLSGYDRDVLEWNHKRLAESYRDWLALVEESHQQELTRLRNLHDVGQYAALILLRARRAGRKTIRIDDLLTEAEQHVIDQRAEKESA